MNQQQNSKCPVCRKKEMNWLHEISCREHNPLAWYFLDFVRAGKSRQAKERATYKFWETAGVTKEYIIAKG